MQHCLVHWMAVDLGAGGTLVLDVTEVDALLGPSDFKSVALAGRMIDALARVDADVAVHVAARQPERINCTAWAILPTSPAALSSGGRLALMVGAIAVDQPKVVIIEEGQQFFALGG